MTDRFSLRFVLSSGRPTFEDLRCLWAEQGHELRRLEDGVVELWRGERALVRLDLLRSEDARGKALLGSILVEARRYGDEDAVQTVTFLAEHASGVLIAQPDLQEESDVEQALEPLDVLWEHLFAQHGGLLQVDGEGIYVEEGPLFEV